MSSSTERDQTIDHLRGVDTLDEDKDGNTTEDRAWKLGDVFHSTPVLITPPVLALNDSSYQAFKTAQAGRTKILIAGANDGMLHAFRESDGVELWAFIPPDLLDNLKNLNSTSGDHLFYVDASPIAADIKVGSTWKTIVVFGERRGGRYYYALDITDTTNPSFMWSFTDTKMGETWSEPAIGKVKIGTTDKFVMFAGGGYDTAQNNATGKAFFAIDLSNGTKLFEYYNSTSGDDRQYMNFSVGGQPDRGRPEQRRVRRPSLHRRRGRSGVEVRRLGVRDVELGRQAPLRCGVLSDEPAAGRRILSGSGYLRRADPGVRTAR